MNLVWLFFIITGILFAMATGRVDVVTDAAFSSAEKAVTIAFGLIGAIALWSGIVKIAEEAGFTQLLAWTLRPVIRWLFPSLPSRSPAAAAVLMSMGANLLGLGNAATPLGLKAMEEMQRLNPTPDEATDAMCTFLAITTSSITLIPATVLALRAKLGSSDPAEIVGTTIVATFFSTAAAIIADRLLRRVTILRFRRRR